jgi:Flp pilus assembly protein TadG
MPVPHLNSSAPSRPGRGGDETGAAAVEFALVLPILILLLFGIIQFSIAYNRIQGLHAAAREGARVASLPHTTSGEIDQRIRDALSGVIKDPAAVNISVEPGSTRPCKDRSGKTVVVTAEYPTDIDIPLWGKKALILTGEGTFRCE